MKKILFFALFSFLFTSLFAQEEEEETSETEAQSDVGCYTQDKKVTQLLGEAYKALTSNNNSLGKAKLDEAIEKEPTNAKAYFYYAEMLYNNKKTDEALEKYEKAYQLCSRIDPYIPFKIGLIYYNKGDYQTASEKFNLFLDAPANDTAAVAQAEDYLGKADFYNHIYKDTVPFNPSAVEGVSTKDDEYLAILSPDNELMLFTRRLMKQDKFATFGSSSKVEEFSMAEKVNGTFLAGEALPAPFNRGRNEGGASMSLNNKEIFVTVCNQKDGYGSCDIYSSRFDGKKWSDLENLGPWVNDSTWQSQASLSADGNTLYFSSDREGGLGGKDIWKIERAEDGGWSSPINLGKPINTAGDEKSPFIHTDNFTLYFSTNGHPSLGGFDIYYAKKDLSGNWQNPKNLGYPINSEADDLGFFVSIDGKYGYFSSNKLAGIGGWDVYQFDLYDKAKPEKVLVLKGKVLDENGEVVQNAKMEIRDLVSNEVSRIEVDSTSGEFVFSKVSNHDQIVFATGDGYFYNSTLLEKDDKKAVGTIKMNLPLKSLQSGGSYKIENIYFDNDSYNLKGESKLELDNLVRFLEMNPQINIEVQGHTDNIGNDESNRLLSRNRAKSVVDYLISKSIADARLTWFGYGETKPIADNNTEEGRGKNRRTEVKIL